MIKKLNKYSIPIAIVVAGLLIAGVVIFINLRAKESTPVSPEKTLAQEIGEKTINYINENLLGEGMTASLIEAKEEEGLVKIKLKVGENELSTYATLDGKYFFPQAFNMEEPLIVQEPEIQTPEPQTETTLSPEELTKFIACLKKADFVIYGANWCGWTKKLVETLGGWDMVKPIYVECTKNEELCKEKEIQGYPTILIKDKEYEGARSLEQFGAATGCEVPEGVESNPGGSAAGGCGR